MSTKNHASKMETKLRWQVSGDKFQLTSEIFEIVKIATLKTTNK